MNRLSAILPAAQVLVSVDATSKKRAFEEAGLLFETLHGLNRALITDSLFARERLGSTGLGHGVAIPHGRIKGLKQPLAAVFQLANPIGFDAPDEQPVQLMIFLLVPEAATQKHLEILSEIAELLSDSRLREQMKTATEASAARPDHGLAVGARGCLKQRFAPTLRRCAGAPPRGADPAWAALRRIGRPHAAPLRNVAGGSTSRYNAVMKPTVVSADVLFEDHREP
jgi:nitrogen PTS system EIIA component